MVRRFFGQRLLELRVQRYENGKTLGQLEAGGPLDAPPPDLAAKWQEEMKVYVRRSGSLLVPCDVIRGTGATAAEVRVVGQAVLEWKTEALDADVGRLEGLRVAFQAKLQRGEPDRDAPSAGAARGIRYDTRVIRRFFTQWEAELRGQRDENRRTLELSKAKGPVDAPEVGVLETKVEELDAAIDRLEGLRDRLAEALRAATVPCGLTADGKEHRPLLVHRVRDILDDPIRTSMAS